MVTSKLRLESLRLHLERMMFENAGARQTDGQLNALPKKIVAASFCRGVVPHKVFATAMTYTYILDKASTL